MGLCQYETFKKCKVLLDKKNYMFIVMCVSALSYAFDVMLHAYMRYAHVEYGLQAILCVAHILTLNYEYVFGVESWHLRMVLKVEVDQAAHRTMFEDSFEMVCQRSFVGMLGVDRRCRVLASRVNVKLAARRLPFC